MPTELLSLFFGLSAALAWGLGDFSGGLATRRVSVLWVILTSSILGIFFYAGLGLVFREPFPPLPQLGIGLAAGVVGGLGIIALFRAMAVGHMGIVSPVSAVLTAGIPVVFSAVFQGLPSGLQVLGFALALAGVWVVSRPDSKGVRSDGLLLAVLSGFAFAGFKILTAQLPDGSLFWPLGAARVGGGLLMLLLFLGLRERPKLVRSAIPLAAFSGILDSLGNVGFLLSAQTGRLDSAAVLSALYPAFTAVLAWVILKERLNVMQIGGIALMLVAIPLIAQK